MASNELLRKEVRIKAVVFKHTDLPPTLPIIVPSKIINSRTGNSSAVSFWQWLNETRGSDPSRVPWSIALGGIL